MHAGDDADHAGVRFSVLSPLAIVAITSEPKRAFADLAAAAEEARAADHGSRDGVDQERAAALA